MTSSAARREASTLLALICCSGCSDSNPAPKPTATNASVPPSAEEVWFEETALRRKVVFQHVAARERRFHFPEIMGAGAGLADVDADGDLDLYLVQSGDIVDGPAASPSGKLLVNRGDGTFEDATASSGLERSGGYGIGCAFADVDGDLDLDLYLSQLGQDRLYLNDGQGHFTDATSRSGIVESGWSSGAAFFDADADGDLDLYVANYVVWSLASDILCRSADDRRDYCQPLEYAQPERDALFINRGDGTFEDATERSGVGSKLGNGLGVTCGDFDGDRRADVFVANDMDANFLWLNRGNGTFEERGLLAGCAFNAMGHPEACMGVVAADADQDGDLDLFMTNYWGQKNTLYENLSGRGFRDVTVQSGLATPSLPFTAFGVGFEDFDHDGFEDIYVANGRVTYILPLVDPSHPYAEPNQVFRGQGNMRWSELLPRGGTATPLVDSSRGTAFGDIDGDGDIDVIVTNNGGAPYVLENVATKRGHSVMFDVRDQRGRIALLARVSLRAGERTWYRQVMTAYSYASSNDARVHFGLGEVTRIDEVRVDYPDGTALVVARPEVDRLHVLRPR